MQPDGEDNPVSTENLQGRRWPHREAPAAGREHSQEEAEFLLSVNLSRDGEHEKLSLELCKKADQGSLRA